VKSVVPSLGAAVGLRAARLPAAAGTRQRQGWGGLVRTGLAVVLLLISVAQGRAAGPSFGAQGRAAGPSFVLRAKAVYPLTAEQPGPIKPGVVIVRDGRIAAAGPDLPLPPDLPLIDLRDEIVCPGFVSAGCGLAGQHAGPHAVSGGYFAIDAYDAYDDYAEWLARGTTTVHLSPGEHRLVSGVGAVVKLAGPPELRTLIAEADLVVTLGVFSPPPIVKPPFYASSDVPIEPARRQRPDSRLGQYLGLREALAAAEPWLTDPEAHRWAEFDYHALSFAKAWAANLPLRIQVRRAEDIEGALELARLRPGTYLVGLTEADRLAGKLAAAGIPTVLRVEESYRHPGANVGPDPEALEPKLTTAGRLTPPFALAGAAGDLKEDLRMAAILAVRGGMPPEQALAAITRLPAEILGVADRVGSLAPGSDADLLVLTAPPLDINASVRRVYVNGEPVFEAPTNEALVVRAGHIWVGNGSIVCDGAVLIGAGRIQAVGQRVPHPPFARIIDAGPAAFVTPGFIDAHGHLGLEGDQTVATPDLAPHRLVGAAGREFLRVAQAGVTTVIMAPYRGTARGVRLAAIKTAGATRSARVVRELCGLRFSLRGQDPLTGIAPLKAALEAGKKYDESWKKYEADLAKWKEGQPADGQGRVASPGVPAGQPDPITGKWEFTLRGAPLPQPVSGHFVARLSGNLVEARFTDPFSGTEVAAHGTYSGNRLTLEVATDTPMGRPTVEATLEREDYLTGHVSAGNYSVEFEATRVDKRAVEFRVGYARARTKDGRPLPPEIDENLEPFRPLLAAKIPAVVEVETAAQAVAAVKLFVDEHKLSLVLLATAEVAEALAQLTGHKEQLGIVAPPDLDHWRARKPYNFLADLSRHDLRIALRSDAEDGARHLPLMALYAVRQGLGAEAALRALTIDAARMYRLDDRIGSLEPGKDADLLIFQGHPLDAGSRLERVLVAGQEVPHEP